jgi:hypothetical protein
MINCGIQNLQNIKIWKTYDQLWNPKLQNIKIWKTCDQLWNPKFAKSEKLPDFYKPILFVYIWGQNNPIHE